MKKIIILALLLAPMTIFAQKFGHFNSGDIVKLMPEFTQAQTEIQTLGEQYQKDLKMMEEEFNTKAASYQTQRDSLPENIRKRREAELQDLQQRYQQTYASSQEELDKIQSEKLQAIQAKVLAAVKQIGEAGGYVYIMDASTGIPFISTTLSTDITAELKQKLGIK